MDPNLLPTTFDGKMDHVIEEASEVIKVIIKIKRFGLYSYHPNDPTKLTNKARLYEEMEDLKAAVASLNAELNSIQPSHIAATL